MSGKPVYSVSNLSNAMKRPNINDSIYSALHGPTASNSKVVKHLVGDVLRKIYYLNQDESFQREQPLYLYHGERYIHTCTSVLNKICFYVTMI